MKVINDQHDPVCNSKTKAFGQLHRGDVFEHGGRILMKLEPFWYVSSTESRCHEESSPVTLLKTNAIRIKGNPGNCDDGRMSRFENSTMVTPCDRATLYLKG